jgi:hypothetical protein
MWNQIWLTLTDTEKEDSLSNRLRSKRFGLFNRLLSTLPTPVKIIDIGGRVTTWKNAGFCADSFQKVFITILNPEAASSAYPHIQYTPGDACDLSQFRDHEFDIVFSNSVIEHVGDFDAQHRMADEVRRVGKRYFVQTPNYYFPIEPHFLVPGFQFFPLSFKVFLIRHFTLGRRPKVPEPEAALQMAKSVRLLTRKEVSELFPEAQVYEEKFLGLTKSFVAYYGW